MDLMDRPLEKAVFTSKGNETSRSQKISELMKSASVESFLNLVLKN